MTRPLILAAVLTCFATVAMAIPITGKLIGETDDPVYTERVKAENGKLYNCKPRIKTGSQEPTRDCILADRETASVFDAGTGGGIGVASAVAGGVVLLGAIASGLNSGTVTTTSAKNAKP